MATALIGNVSDTAFWVAHHRALESERADALFRDPLARILAGDRGRQIADEMPQPQMTSWAIVIRTCIIDDFIRYAIAQGADMILNLGAGLDTRPYRMELPGSLAWIEVDYPDVIAFKESRYLAEETERLGRRLPLSLLAKSIMSIRQVFLRPERRESLRKFVGYALLEPP